MLSFHELKGTHWYIFSDNIYGYDAETKFWCSLDGVRMEASVNAKVVDSFIRPFKPLLKERDEIVEFRVPTEYVDWFESWY